MKTAIYFSMFLLLLCMVFIFIIRQNMKIQSMYEMNNIVLKGMDNPANITFTVPRDLLDEKLNLSKNIFTGDNVNQVNSRDEDFDPITDDEDNVKLTGDKYAHTKISENKDIILQIKDESQHVKTLDSLMPHEEYNTSHYVTSRPHIKLWSTPRVTDASQVLCDNYEVLPTQIINGVWQSSNSKLDDEGNSLGKDYRGFKSYFDDRDPEHTFIWVIGSPNYDITVQYNTGLYCTLWFPSGAKYTTVVPQKDTLVRTGLKMLNGQKSYQINIKCPFRTMDNEKPAHVTISFEPCVLSMKLPVHYPSGEGSRSAAVCVPVIYDRIGSKEALATIEWVELYKHFGVSQFFFYSVNAVFDPPVAKVFDYYSKHGVIVLTHVHPVTTNSRSVVGFTLSKSVHKNSFDDCLFRNIHEYKYLINVDLDDIMVPKQHPSFEAMVDSINEKYNHREGFSGYHVRNINFFLDYGPTLNNSDPLITSRYFGNSGAGTIRHKTKIKPIVNTKKCLIMWNHSCLKGVGRGDRPTAVDFQKAQNYHFRRSCAASFVGAHNETKPADRGRLSPCDENLRNGVEDNFILQFRPHLLPKVLEVAKLLNLDLNEHY